MILHRRAAVPPCGPTSDGSVHSLCGRFLHPLRTTTDPDLVSCAVCERSTTSPRTVEKGRLA